MLTLGPPRIDPNFTKIDVENKRSSFNLMFKILEAAPEVIEENTFFNFTRYDDYQSEVTFTFGTDSVNRSISNVGLEDEGNYTLETSNLVGSSSGTIHLDVKSMNNTHDNEDQGHMKSWAKSWDLWCILCREAYY